MAWRVLSVLPESGRTDKTGVVLLPKFTGQPYRTRRAASGSPPLARTSLLPQGRGAHRRGLVSLRAKAPRDDRIDGRKAKA